jgi:CheY-like chemotaxis protein
LIRKEHAVTDKNPEIILHVNDDQDDHYLFRYAINKVDPSVIIREAKDGRKAVDFLTQAKLFGDLPGLIILDMNMPVMNGMETFEQIKRDSILSSIKVVVFTTSMNDKEFNYWEKENVPAFIKPANLDEFVECVKKILSYSPHNI